MKPTPSGFLAAAPGGFMEPISRRQIPVFPTKSANWGLQKIICPLALRLNKALIAQCMMVGTAAVHRDLGKHYEQNRVSYRGGAAAHQSACGDRIPHDREWSKTPRPGW